MVMLPCSSACAPVLSVTRTVNVNVPAVVGVPERTAGGDAARLSPGGSCPAAIVSLRPILHHRFTAKVHRGFTAKVHHAWTVRR